jgi:ribosome-binding protein aMBF1 (putative translation factor)
MWDQKLAQENDRNKITTYLAASHVRIMPKNSAPRVISLEVVRLLKNERIRRGISMNRLAEKAGLSQSMVSLLERGMRTPTLDTLLRIAAALEIDLPELIRRASSAAKRTRS